MPAVCIIRVSLFECAACASLMPPNARSGAIRTDADSAPPLDPTEPDAVEYLPAVHVKQTVCP